VLVGGLTHAAGAQFWIRLEVAGASPTTLRARVWADGAAEPGGWNVQTTDSTAALQGAGGIGVNTYLSGSTTNAPVAFSFDGLESRSLNQAPIATFTSSCVGTICNFDGSASADADGSIDLVQWSFGDGATATGTLVPNHVYAVPGTYPVTLTVRDNLGYYGTVTTDVVVS
jgi:PKD repeat protein